ncbi:energy-coupling factor transporter transmembrane protein EcfT [uncultured Chloroflexus sp.]|uniref:energy-coupling factor transporter transmembrane component T family protein n=1 Tax=uncultured Chloroflexus sp. TaxID=214040 RepID=UPI00262FB737|nr:energy-coupling factor transporter transmembrane component T [uncultured Chloroflexus sp.]
MMKRLDPRTKLALVIGYMIFITADPTEAWVLSSFGFIVLMIVATGKVKAYLQWLRIVATIALTWIIVTWWMFDLATAVIVGLRLTALLSAFFLFFQTTTPTELGNALVQSGLPYWFAFTLSASLQLVPVMSQTIQNIIAAQRSRGIPLEPGWAALRHYPALLVPLLVQSFRLADELAEAMEVRGFSRTKRTFRYQYRFHLTDWLAIVGEVLYIGIALSIRFNPLVGILVF